MEKTIRSGEAVKKVAGSTSPLTKGKVEEREAYTMYSVCIGLYIVKTLKKVVSY